jgi:hypothetical protein
MGGSLKEGLRVIGPTSGRARLLVGGGASDLNPTVERGVTDYKGADISWKLLSSRDIYILN